MPSQEHSYVPSFSISRMTVAVRMPSTSMATEIRDLSCCISTLYVLLVILGQVVVIEGEYAVEGCFVFVARSNRNAGLRPEQQRLLLGSKDLDDYARLSIYSTQHSISLVLVECLERSRGLIVFGWEIGNPHGRV